MLTPAESRERTELEQRLATLAANLPGFICQHVQLPGGRPRLTYIGAGVRDLVGISAAQAVAAPQVLSDRIHPQDLARLLAAVEASARELTQLQIELRVHHPQRGEIWAEVRTTPERRADGNIVWNSLIFEITRNKENESRLGLLEFAISRVRESVHVIDETSQFVYVNDAACQTLGFSRAELMQMTQFDIDPDLTAAESQEWRSRLKRLGHLTQERHHRRKDGRIVPVEVSSSAFEYQGRALCLSLVEDITERLRTEAALRDQQAIQRAHELKSEFLSRMSHELRTPMNAVLGFAQLLLNDHLEPPTHIQARRLERLLAAGNHLLLLMNDVLDLTRLESGRAQLVREPVRLADIIANAFEILELQALAHTIRIEGPIHGDQTVWADTVRLGQVVLNLLSNAIKYNREGGRVDIQIGSHGQRHFLVIADTGHGIAAEHLSQLFEPFNRLGAERSGVEGTGIGLAITSKLIEQMGGVIEVQSTPGAGSRFTVWLEAAPDKSAAHPMPLAEHAATSDRSSQINARIVYIEDDPVNAMLMEEILAQRPDIACVIAATGKAGVALVERTLPDLVLIDMVLPDISGNEVLRRLRDMPATAAIDCVALSANATPHDITQARQNGFDDYLTKPIDIQSFFEWIDARLDRRPG